MTLQQIEGPQLDKIANAIRDTSRKMNRELATILNEVAEDVESSTTPILGVSDRIRRVLHVNESGIEPFLDTVRATPRHLESQVELKRSKKSGSLSRRNSSIGLRHFNPIQTPYGVSLRIYRDRPATQIKSAFGPKIRRLGRGVYKRIGKERLPIRKLPGVSVTRVWIKRKLHDEQIKDNARHIEANITEYLNERAAIMAFGKR